MFKKLAVAVLALVAMISVPLAQTPMGVVSSPGTWSRAQWDAWSITKADFPGIMRDTNNDLKALSTSIYNYAFRLGFTTRGDAPWLLFVKQSGTCVGNSMANDGGSCVDSTFNAAFSWRSVPDYDGLDVRQFGAKNDAVLGAIGAACTGITGTDNIAAFNAATLWAINNHSTVTSGSKGAYRLNSRWDIRTDATWINFQPFNDNTLRHPKIDIKAQVVTCGTDAGVYIYSQGYAGFEVSIFSLTGPGSGSSLPTAYGGAENIGVLIEGSGSILRSNFISDYTMDIILQNSFSNKLYLGDVQASWQALTLRDGSGGSAYSTQANEIHYRQIGGVYFANTDADPGKSFRISRSCNVGIRAMGSGSGNHFYGGTVEYCSKGTAPKNIYNSQSDNEFFTWVEGNYNDGYNVYNDGNRNIFRLSDMANPHAGGFSLHNTLIGGTGNRVYGPHATTITYGDNAYGAGNWANDDASLGAWTPAGAGCGAGSNPTFTINDAVFTKEGRVVHPHMKVTVTAANSCTGSWTVSGLPYTSSVNYASIINGYNENTNAIVQCIVLPNTSAIKIVNATGTLTVANSDKFICDGTYRTD